MIGWLRRGTIYQVYPRSFEDSDGDGVGDLDGVRSRLPYLKRLGVDAVWLSPFYRSPMADFGYDVSDHCDVDPRFGTLADFDALAREAHRLGLKLILDYVPNHTSIEHPWFREHPDRYLWRAGEPDAPPTNWVSNFGGSAWAWDEDRGAWYYHAYLPEQPDLDWRNPDVREAMLGVLRFWVEHGADGFRIDALRETIKDDRWRDNPPNPAWREGDDPYRALIPAYTTDRDEVEQERDPGSMLSLYRRLLALRRAEDALATGDWECLRADDGVLAYLRGDRFLVALNLTGDERALALDGRAGEDVLGGGGRVAGELRLAPDAARIVRLTRGRG